MKQLKISGGKTLITGALCALASLFVGSAWATISRTVPGSTSTKDYVAFFVPTEASGEEGAKYYDWCNTNFWFTGTLDNKINWITSNKNSALNKEGPNNAPLTGSHTCATIGSSKESPYPLTLIDKTIFEDSTTDQVKVEYVEGWNVQIGVYGGAHVTVEKIQKWQDQQNPTVVQSFVCVDEDSSIVFAAGNLTSFQYSPEFYCAAADGIEFQKCNGGPAKYYLSGAGSVKYSNSNGFSGTHTICQADFSVENATGEGAAKVIKYKKLISGKVNGATASFDNNATVTCTTEGITVSQKDSVTIEDDVGAYALATLSDGIYLEYLDQVDAGHYAATISEDVNWSNITWDEGDVVNPIAVYTLTVTDDATITIDSNLTAISLTATLPEGKTLTVNKADGTIVSFNSYDFSSAEGSVVIGFGTGIAAITAGKNTEVASTGSASITIGEGKQLTVKGTSSRLKKSSLNNKGVLKFVGGTQSIELDGTNDKSNGKIMLGASTRVECTISGAVNKTYDVEGVDDTSMFRLDCSEGFGIASADAENSIPASTFKNLTLVASSCGSGMFWLERGTYDNVHFIASCATHLRYDSGFQPVFKSLGGGAAITRAGNEELIIESSKAARYEGSSSVTFVLRGNGAKNQTIDMNHFTGVIRFQNITGLGGVDFYDYARENGVIELDGVAGWFKYNNSHVIPGEMKILDGGWEINDGSTGTDQMYRFTKLTGNGPVKSTQNRSGGYVIRPTRFNDVSEYRGKMTTVSTPIYIGSGADTYGNDENTVNKYEGKIVLMADATCTLAAESSDVVTVDNYVVTTTANDDETTTYTSIAANAKIGDKFYATLAAAVAAAEAEQTVTLLKDVAENVAITADKTLTIDLGTHTLTGKISAFDGTVTVQNGTIVGGFNAYDSSTVTLASTASVQGPAVVWGDGNFGEEGCKTPTLNVYGTITHTGNAAISFQGTDMSHAIANIYEGATVTSTDDIAVFQPSGILTISGGTITGKTAVYQKSGSLTVSGGSLNANGEVVEFVHRGSGANATGDAIVIESCGYPNGAPTASITGGTITSANNNPVASYAYGDGIEVVVGFVTGGTFNKEVAATYIASGYALTDNGDGTYTVTKTTTWPTGWTAVETGSDYYGKLETWIAKYPGTSISSLSKADEACFLMGVAPGTTDLTVVKEINPTVDEYGKITITIPAGVNGVVYVRKANTPAGAKTARANQVTPDNGVIKVDRVDADKGFYLIGVGFTVPATPEGGEGEGSGEIGEEEDSEFG